MSCSFDKEVVNIKDIPLSTIFLEKDEEPDPNLALKLVQIHEDKGEAILYRNNMRLAANQIHASNLPTYWKLKNFIEQFQTEPNRAKRLLLFAGCPRDVEFKLSQSSGGVITGQSIMDYVKEMYPFD